nr:MAG TPA: minor tail protein [Caudoviricetes sp.]
MADVDITSLSVEISAESQGAELNIDKLTAAISNLRTKGNVTKVVNSLDKLAGSIATLKQASAGMSGLDKITNFLNGLSNVNTTASAKSINTVVNAIKKIPAAVSGLNGVDFYSMSGSITQLTNALAPLSILDASNLKALGSAFNAIGKVPDLTDKLKATDLNSFASSCQKISTALTPLASQLDKVGNAFAKLPPQLSKVVTQANRVTAANEKQRKSYLSLSNQMNGFMRNMAKLVSLKAIAEYLGNAVAKFNDFYEATDLFHNAMGNLSGEADTLISKMQGLLGVDPTKAMTYMATIQSLGTSFGLASDKAYILSKNLTQLAYDEGSYWNKDVAETFTAMSSAISGEIEPIRRLGIDLTQARLQQELLALGFNKQVSSLSQADKAVLRYIAIMKQTANVQGNLAQTIQSPANQIKILKAQLDMLAKSVGSLLYPALKSILPPLIAAVQLIREFVEWVAKLMGVKVVFTDFTKSADSVGGIGDAMDDTADSTKKAAKALKDYTMGFDELNIIDPTQGSSSSGSGASAGNILGDVDLSSYDMFKNYVGTTVDEIKEKLRKLAPFVAAIGAGFAAWAIGNALLTALKDTHDWAYKLGKIVGGLNPELVLVAATVALIVGRFVQLYQSSENFRQGLTRIKDLIYLAGLGFTQGWNISLTDGKLGESIKWLKEALSNLGQAIWNLIPEEWQGKISTAFETIQKVVKDLDLDLGDLVMTLIGIGLTISGHPVAGLAVLGFEAISVAVRGLGSENEAEAFQLKSDWHDAFVNFGTIAAETVADIITALGNLINDFAILIGWIQNGVSETEMLDIQMNGNFLEGAIASLAQVIHNMGVFIGWITKGVDESDRLAIAANGNFAEKFVLLIADVINGIKDAVTWFGKLIDKVSKFNPLSVGKNIIDGITKGITGNTNVSNDAAKQLTDGIKKTTQDELDIHSPSKWFEGIGIYIDQGLANGITVAQGYVDDAMQGLIGEVTNAGNQFIEQGKQTGIGFVNNLDQTLTSTWQQLDTNLQNDFFGTIQNLWEAAQSGDVKTIGTTIAAVLWHAMGEEQRTQIKTIATNMITDLSTQLTNALSTLSAQAYQIGGELLNGITSKFGEILQKTKQLGGSLSSTFQAVKGPLKSVAMAISAALSGGLASAFPTIYASMGTLISTIGASFVAMLHAIGAALSATIFGIPAGLVALGAAAVLAVSIASIVGGLGGKKSSSGSSYGSTGYNESDLGQIDYSNVPGTSQYNDANSGLQSSYAASATQQLSASEIKEAVYNGAYNALLDYKQRYGSEDKNNVFKFYLDGKQITASVEKTQSDRGRTIMGNEAYSY